MLASILARTFPASFTQLSVRHKGLVGGRTLGEGESEGDEGESEGDEGESEEDEGLELVLGRGTAEEVVLGGRRVEEVVAPVEVNDLAAEAGDEPLVEEDAAWLSASFSSNTTIASVTQSPTIATTHKQSKTPQHVVFQFELRTARSFLLVERYS